MVLQRTAYANNNDLWQKLVEREADYIQARITFLDSCPNKMAVIQNALHNPVERGTALQLLNYFPLEDRQGLFQDLLELASVSHSDIDRCRQAILTLPKQWLLVHIENVAEELLENGTDEEYRRLLELYMLIDRALAQRLTIKALQNSDPDIREVGDDFDRYLKNGQFFLAG